LCVKQAEQKLDETHRDKVSRVMRDWAQLEAKYQETKIQVHILKLYNHI
jgi:amyloid beta A4 protein